MLTVPAPREMAPSTAMAIPERNLRTGPDGVISISRGRDPSGATSRIIPPECVLSRTGVWSPTDMRDSRSASTGISALVKGPSSSGFSVCSVGSSVGCHGARCHQQGILSPMPFNSHCYIHKYGVLGKYLPRRPVGSGLAIEFDCGASDTHSSSADIDRAAAIQLDVGRLD